jgi:hypothetical protein
VDEATDLVVLALPEPAHSAIVPVLVPEMGIDVPDRVEGRHEFVTMMPGASGKFLRPRQIEADALERMWQRHERTSMGSNYTIISAPSSPAGIDVDQSPAAAERRPAAPRETA